VSDAADVAVVYREADITPAVVCAARIACPSGTAAVLRTGTEGAGGLILDVTVGVIRNEGKEIPPEIIRFRRFVES
jgi:hypothetical protein